MLTNTKNGNLIAEPEDVISVSDYIYRKMRDAVGYPNTWPYAKNAEFLLKKRVFTDEDLVSFTLKELKRRESEEAQKTIINKRLLEEQIERNKLAAKKERETNKSALVSAGCPGFIVERFINNETIMPKTIRNSRRVWLGQESPFQLMLENKAIAVCDWPKTIKTRECAENTVSPGFIKGGYGQSKAGYTLLYDFKSNYLFYHLPNGERGTLRIHCYYSRKKQKGLPCTTGTKEGSMRKFVIYEGKTFYIDAPDKERLPFSYYQKKFGKWMKKAQDKGFDVFWEKRRGRVTETSAVVKFLGQEYHFAVTRCKTGRDFKDGVICTLNSLKRQAARRNLAESKLGSVELLQKTFVSWEHSRFNDVNCEPGTRQFSFDTWKHIGAAGPCAVRADLVLEVAKKEKVSEDYRNKAFWAIMQAQDVEIKKIIKRRVKKDELPEWNNQREYYRTISNG